MITNIDSLRSAIRAGTLLPGGIPFVTPFRSTAERVQMPQTSDPYLYVVLDGVLRLYTPSGIMDYMPGQYSISKIDTPLSGTVLDFSGIGTSWRSPSSSCPAMWSRWYWGWTTIWRSALCPRG